MGHLWIANSITDLIEGDVREHIPLERIPLAGDVLGMGTTTSYLVNHLFNLLGLQGHQLVLPHVLVLEKPGSSGKRLFDRHGVVDRVHETFAA